MMIHESEVITNRISKSAGFQLFNLYIAPILLLVVDYVTIVLALFTTFYLRKKLLPFYFPSLSELSLTTGYLYFVIPFIYIALILYEHLNTKRLPFWQSAKKLFKITVYATVIAIGVMFFVGNSREISRIFVAISGVVTFIYLAVAHYITKRILIASQLWQHPIIVVGAGKTTQLLADYFVDNPELGYKIVGVIEDRAERPLVYKYPLLGNFSDIEQVIIASGIKDVVIAAPGLKRESLVTLVNRIQPLVKNLSVIPNLFGMPVSNIEVNTMFNQKVLLLTMKNEFARLNNRLFKKLIDLFLGLVTLLGVAPLMLLIALIIKLDSPGPVLYIAKRIGKGDREFNCYKFRTMYLHNDEILEHYLATHSQAKLEWEEFAKLRDFDPRVTRMGKWLRQFSLDELPQIFNVIIGNMSLVGPRPYLPRERKRMSSFANIILEVVPGITGLWQVSGRNEISFDERLSLDTWYIRNWSPWLDFTIMFKTVRVIFEKKGAY